MTLELAPLDIAVGFYEKWKGSLHNSALYASLGVMQAWDAYSTSAALKAGAREANPTAAPFAGNAGSMLGLKAATTAGTIFFAERLWKKNKVGATPLLVIPAAISLALFVWLLTLHGTAAGRTYAAYGGVYVAVALLWLWRVEGQRPDAWDLAGAAISVAGMMVIAFGRRG